MKTSLNAATPASVTGVVGSVTGNVRELDQGAKVEPGELQAYASDLQYAGCATRVLVVKSGE